MTLAITMIGCAPARAPGEVDLSRAGAAADVLHRMFLRYTSARSYEDSGTIVATMRHDGQEDEASRGEFKTAFDRAAHAVSFRWLVTKGNGEGRTQRGAMWRRGSDPTSVWFSDDPRTQSMPLADSIAYFSALSKGSSMRVPQMLFFLRIAMPEDFAYRLEAEEVVRGIPCVRLRSDEADHLVILWVGKADHALRKRYERRRSEPRFIAQSPDALSFIPEDARQFMAHEPAVTIETTLEFDPTFDQPVDPARFEFAAANNLLQ